MKKVFQFVSLSVVLAIGCFAADRCVNCPRDGRGHIARSSQAKAQFKRLHPCPANGHRYGACPGYVIDHKNPLECGGKDVPQNMQWQTIAAGKAKDRWEGNCKLARERAKYDKN